MLKFGALCLGLIVLLVLAFYDGNENATDPQNREASALDRWTEALRDPNRKGYSEEDVADAFRRAGPEAIPRLIEALRVRNLLVGNRAGHLLAERGKEALPALLEALQDQDTHLRVGAARVLCLLGPKGEPAINELLKTLKDNDPLLRTTAAGALTSIGVAALPVVVKDLDSDDEAYVTQLLQLIHRLGPRAADALDRVRLMLHDQRPQVRATAIVALGAVAGSDKNVIREVRAKLKDDPDPNVRLQAANVLKEIDPTLYQKGLKAVQLLQPAEAIRWFDEAIKAEPQQPEYYLSRGHVFEGQRQFRKAFDDYSQALELQPDFTAVRRRRSSIAHGGVLKEHEAAVEDYRRLIAQMPNQFPNDYNNLAWLLATSPHGELRNGREAIKYARQACELTGWRNWTVLDTLAAAYAEAGDFYHAVSWQRKALQDPEFSFARNSVKDEAHARLRLYEMKKPYREE
jgi:tetratricopeptide (TPR) repeat protein